MHKIHPFFVSVTLLLFFTFSFLFKTDFSFDQDLGRHLKLGQIITQTHSIPATNLFSYTNPDFPFLNTHWLFEVFVFNFTQILGLTLLLCFKLAIFLLATVLTLFLIPKKYYPLLLPIGFIFLHVLRERTELRPEIFSFLFTAITYWILQNFSLQPFRLQRKNWRYWAIFTLPIIQLIWINTHIYFIIGLALQAIFIAHLLYAWRFNHQSAAFDKLKTLSLTFTLSLLASLLNPNGLRTLLYPFTVNQNYGYTIVENQTIFLLENIHFSDRNFLFVKLSAVLIILSLIWSVFKKSWTVKNILLPLAGLSLAILNVRNFPHLVFISLPTTIENFGISPNKKFFRLLNFFIALILLGESILYLNGSYYNYTDSPNRPGWQFKQSVAGAVDFLISQKLPQPIFNNFDIGSYLIYKAYPQYPVFVDGRPEAYPKDFFTATYIPIQSTFAQFQELAQKTGIKTVIFSHTDQTPWARNFLTSIYNDPNWTMVYFDDFMVIFVNQESAARLKLTKVDLQNLRINSDDYYPYLRMAITFLNLNQLQLSQFYAQKALDKFPESPTANLLMANFTNNNFFPNPVSQPYLSKSTNWYFW